MQGVTVIEDCYNAGPESMEAALKVLAQTPAAGKRYAVLGGMLELGSYAPERHEAVGRIAAGCADALLAYGAHSEGYVAGQRRQDWPMRPGIRAMRQWHRRCCRGRSREMRFSSRGAAGCAWSGFWSCSGREWKTKGKMGDKQWILQ